MITTASEELDDVDGFLTGFSMSKNIVSGSTLKFLCKQDRNKNGLNVDSVNHGSCTHNEVHFRGAQPTGNGGQK